MCLVLEALLAGSVQASIQPVNSVIGTGGTALQLQISEAIYNSAGQLVSSAAVGDTIEGIFVITSITSNGAGYYPPTTGNVEFTGVFDEYVAGTDGSPANLVLEADNATNNPTGYNVLGSKAMTGATFQSDLR